jgi:HEAT repeat protein
LLLSFAIAPQDPAALIEQLKADDIEVRERAFMALEQMGAAAEGALQKAAGEPESASTTRIRQLLRILELERLLRPRLKKAVPGIARKLALLDESWVPTFLAIAKPPEDADPLSELRSEDLEPLALGAFDRAREADLKTLCSLAASLRLRSCEPHLVRLLRDDDTAVVRAAASSLHSLRGQEAMRIVMRETPDSPAVAWLVLDTVWEDPATGEFAIPSLAALTRDFSEDVRESAFEALRKLRAPEAVSAAVDLSSHPDPARRQTAIRAMKHGSWDDIQGAIVRLLGEPSSGVRIQALGVANLTEGKLPSELRAALMRDPDSEVRQCVVRLVNRWKVREALSEVLPLVKDADAEVRGAAIRAVGTLGTLEQESIVIAALSDPDGGVRRRALEALCNLKSPLARPTAIKLMNDSEAANRYAAVSALSQVTPPPEADVLVMFLETPADDDSYTRAPVAKLLAGVDPSRARDVLVRMIETDRESGEWMAHVMACLKDPVPLLIKSLSGPWRLQKSASQDLLAMGPSETSEPLMRLLEDAPDPSSKSEAARLLGAFRIEGARARLTTLLADPNAEIREAAVAALSDLGGADVDALRARTKDESSDVRTQAARALGRLRAKQAIPDLRRLLEDKDSLVVRAAADSLWNLGDDGLGPWALRQIQARRSGGLGWYLPDRASEIEGLRDLLQDRDSWVRWTAERLLVRAGKDKVAPDLLPLLRDPFTRGAAASGLAELNARSLLPDLAEMLKDVDPIARGGALEALGVMGLEEATSKVRPLLADPDGNNRLKATQTLGLLRDRESIPALRSLLKDRSAFTREAAVRALDAIGAREALPDLLELLKDRDARVYQRACDAIGNLGDSSAISELRRWVKPASPGHPEPEAACRALVKLGAREAAPELIALAKINWWNGGLEALAKLKAPEAIALLNEVLKRRGFDGMRDKIPSKPWDFDTECWKAAEWLGAAGDLTILKALLRFPLPQDRRRAARLLCALGSSEGVPTILERTDPYVEDPFHVLNRLRKPELWKRMAETRLHVSGRDSRRRLMEKVARNAGLKFKWAAPENFAQYDFQFDEAGMEGWTDLISVLNEAVDIRYFHGTPDAWVEAAAPVEIILEDDQIRVLPREEAITFWKKWWADEQKK